MNRARGLVLLSFIMCLVPIAGDLSQAEEIKLTTIVPDQSTVRGVRGTIGTNYRGRANGAIGDNNFIVEGKVGVGTSTPAALLDVDGAGGTILVPRHNAEPADGVAVNGMIYYNNNSNRFRVYQDGAWVILGTSAISVKGNCDGDTAVNTTMPGSGFTYVKTAVGRWTVTFSTACATVPVVMVSCSTLSATKDVLYSIGAYDTTVGGFKVKAAIGSDYGNVDFSFIVVE